MSNREIAIIRGKEYTQKKTFIKYGPETLVSPVTNRPLKGGEVKQKPFWCELCDIKFPDPLNAIKHFTYYRHIDKSRKYCSIFCPECDNGYHADCFTPRLGYTPTEGPCAKCASRRGTFVPEVKQFITEEFGSENICKRVAENGKGDAEQIGQKGNNRAGRLGIHTEGKMKARKSYQKRKAGKKREVLKTNARESKHKDARGSVDMCKIFVGGLSHDTTEEMLANHFGHYGNIVRCIIFVSRGFGFVTYHSSGSVEKVLQARPHVIDEKTVCVKRAMIKEHNTTVGHSETTKLFIGGIDPDLRPDELQQYIENRHPTTAGLIYNINFMKEKESNKNSGFGSLECSHTDFADRLAISEKSFTLKGRKMFLKKVTTSSNGN